MRMCTSKFNNGNFWNNYEQVHVWSMDTSTTGVYMMHSYYRTVLPTAGERRKQHCLKETPQEICEEHNQNTSETWRLIEEETRS